MPCARAIVAERLGHERGVAVRLLDGRLQVRCHVLARAQVLGNVVGRCGGLGHGVTYRFLARRTAVSMSVFCVRLSPPPSSTTTVWPCRLKHPVPRAVLDPHLRDAFAHRLDVARIAGRQPLDPDEHTGAGADIAQSVQPLGVDLRPADFEHAPK